MGTNKVEKAKKWLEDRVNAAYASRVDNLALAGLQIVGAQAGRILCNFLVPRHLAATWLGPKLANTHVGRDHNLDQFIGNPSGEDKDGNWRAGAIATLIDNVGSVAIASTTGSIKISVDFDISYFSTAKINEEVDIEAITSAHMGQLSYVTVEIRKKGSREMVAVGKQWMASTSRVPSKL